MSILTSHPLMWVTVPYKSLVMLKYYLLSYQHDIQNFEVLYVVLVTEEVVLQGFGEHVVDVVYAPQVVVGQRNLSLVFLKLRCLDVVL